MTDTSAHLDSFARDNLPPREAWPRLDCDLPELDYPARLNCATELLDRMVAEGHGDKPLFLTPNGMWTYGTSPKSSTRTRANRFAASSRTP